MKQSLQEILSPLGYVKVKTVENLNPILAETSLPISVIWYPMGNSQYSSLPVFIQRNFRSRNSDARHAFTPIPYDAGVRMTSMAELRIYTIDVGDSSLNSGIFLATLCSRRLMKTLHPF